MEIISYVGSSSAVRKSSSSPAFNLSSLKRKNGGKKALSLSGKMPAAVYGLSEFTPVSKSHARVEKEFTLLGLSKVISIFIFFILLLIVPYTIFNFLSFAESHFNTVTFDSASTYENEALDAAMSRFAMEEISGNVDENGNLILEDGSVLTAAEVGIGEKVTFKEYKVRPGDSISSISLKFGLSNISTLIAVNDISNVRVLRSGQKLKIPSVDGLLYKVNSGDSLNSLSVKYHVSVEEILDANDLDSEVLSKGMELFIPGAKMDSISLKKAMGELFVYPITASWRLTSRFGPRKDPFSGVPSNHTGIDMACPTGTPIRAALSGKVVYAGWSNIFGNYVIISHGNGYQTLYGHMSKISVKKGQMVDQSTRIGLVGSTGYSTGPHLHFTVYKNGNLVDPLSLLKR